MIEVVVATAVGSLIGIVVGGIIVGTVSREWGRKVARLVGRVDTLEGQRMTGVERRLDKIEDGGCVVGRQVLEKLTHVTSMLAKVDLKLDRIAETTAKQAAEIAANSHYIGNLDKSFQRHRETAHG